MFTFFYCLKTYTLDCILCLIFALYQARFSLNVSLYFIKVVSANSAKQLNRFSQSQTKPGHLINILICMKIYVLENTLKIKHSYCSYKYCSGGASNSGPQALLSGSLNILLSGLQINLNLN